MSVLKKRVPLGIGCLGLLGGLVFSNLPSPVSANAIFSAAAMEAVSQPCQTGPKASHECMGENTKPCADYTCNPTVAP